MLLHPDDLTTVPGTLEGVTWLVSDLIVNSQVVNSSGCNSRFWIQIFPVIILSRKCLAQNLIFSCNLQGGRSLILRFLSRPATSKPSLQSKLEYSISKKCVVAVLTTSIHPTLFSLVCQLVVVLRQDNKFLFYCSTGGRGCQQPASLVGNSNKQVLNFIVVAIATCCHTSASGGCAQARRRISVFWCSFLVAAWVNNQHLLLAPATSTFSAFFTWQSLFAAIQRLVVVALRQGDKFLFSGALALWRRESTTSISCWQQQKASSQLSLRGNSCLLPYCGKWWLPSAKGTTCCCLKWNLTRIWFEHDLGMKFSTPRLHMVVQQEANQPGSNWRER